ncbi:MAG: PilZ domain-containing protein [Candidatus Hodarchaeota archaeon]
MQYTESERRKYPRFNAEIPVDIGLIDLKSGKRAQAQFKGITKDISMEGMGVELDYPASDILSFAPRLVGTNKEFDLDLNTNSGTKDVRGVGEVRWARIHSPSVLRMGVFLKEIRDNEKEKWTNFVMSQRRAFFQDPSWRQKYRGYTLITLPLKFIQDLMWTNVSIHYILPSAFIICFLIIFWFAEMRYYHVIIPLGIAIMMALLTRSRSFSKKYPRPKWEILHSLLLTLHRSLRFNRQRQK